MSRSQENQELLKEYAKTRDPEIRNKILLNNVGLVHRCTSQVGIQARPTAKSSYQQVSWDC